MAEPKRAILRFEGGGVGAQLPASDFLVIAQLLEGVESDYRRLNGTGFTHEVRELIAFIAAVPRASLQMRSVARSESLAETGVRSAAPVAGTLSETLDLMTARQVSEFAREHGVRVCPAHVRKCLVPVDQVGPTKRYHVADAKAYVRTKGGEPS